MARGPRERTAPDSLVVVDKPSGLTSHDVVARVRRLAGTRKVGHAGTLDPMATGVLLVGVERTTRLLGHLALTDKAYSATVRLGVSTVTDDAEGDVVSASDASVVDLAAVEAELVALRGDILQRPSAVSAIKVDGVRSYKRVREGEDVELPARPVTVSRFEVLDARYGDGVLDLDVEVECSTGTYVRALARDLGAALGVLDDAGINYLNVSWRAKSVASFAAVSALFVLPTYPTLLAAVEMDDTGTTRIGKYVFNHPFLLPGVIAISLSVALGFIWAGVVL